MRTVVALYDRIDQAREAVKELTDAGFVSEDINLISRDASGEYSRYLNTDRTRAGEDVSEGAATGAGVGAVLGGLGGLLLGLGALAIPGIGPVIAAGPIAATLAGAGIGAVAGGAVGALVDLGIPEEHAQYYAEGVRRGATLVTVRTKDEHAEHVRDLLNHHDPVDLDKTVSNWRSQNWTGFNENVEPLESSRMEFNRSSSRMPGMGSMVDDDSAPMSERDVEMRRPGADYGTPSMDDEDAAFDRQRQEQFMAEEIPVTGDTPADVLERDMAAAGYDEQEWERYDVACRRDFMDRFVDSGRDYAYYQPAYRYGYMLANDERYRDVDWNVIEPEARREWELQGGDTAWDDIKDAVRQAWRTVTGRLMG